MSVKSWEQYQRELFPVDSCISDEDQLIVDKVYKDFYKGQEMGTIRDEVEEKARHWTNTCDYKITTTIEEKESDPVNHPLHYNNHPSGVECIQIIEHMSFNLGSALKYIWRCDLKHNAIEDLKKAIFYINREIQKRENSG